MKHTLTLAAAIAALVSASAMAGKPIKEPQVGGMDVFAAGEPIGKLLDGKVGDGTTYVISTKGYLFSVSKSWDYLPAGALGRSENTLYFSGADCTGEVYADSDSEWRLAQGVVFSAFPNLPGMTAAAYYHPRGSTTQLLNFASRAWGDNNATCYNESGSWELVRVYANNPSVTGVPDGSFATPITFGVP